MAKAGGVWRGTADNDRHSGTERKMLGGAGNDFLERAGAKGPYGQTVEPAGGGRLYGQDGNDRLYAHWAEDRLYGGPGDDGLTGNRLWGGKGDDTLTAAWHPSKDTGLYDPGYKARLVGGRGDDTFVLDAGMNTRLPDFRSRDDRIVVIDEDYGAVLAARLDYDRASGVLSCRTKIEGSGWYSDVVARLKPGTKVTADDLDLILVHA